jgi:hypothetical protein
MKTRFLFVLLAVWQISNNGLAQEVTQWVYLRSIVSDDKTDSISIYSYSTSRATPFAPNRLLIKSRTDTINEIRVENGTSTKLPDGSFSINWNKPSAGVYNMTFIGHNNYRYHVERINQPFRYFILKNLYDNYKPQAGSPAYTIDDIIHNGKIIGFASSRMDSVLTIKEFQVRVRPLTSSGYLNIISSPIFKGDSIPSGYTESLKKYFSGPEVPSRLYMALQNVQASDQNYSGQWLWH